MKRVDKQNLIYPSPTVKIPSIGAVFLTAIGGRDRFGNPWNRLDGL
jgi:L-2-hydroxyglutarate oxidase LhgO